MRSFCCLIAALIGVLPLGAAAATAGGAGIGTDVEALEMRFFEHDYSADTVDDRLSRLEKFVFGETRSGSDKQRMDNLLSAVPADANTSPSPSGSDQAAGKQPANAEPADDDNDGGPGDYPRISALENEILGKTFENEPVKRRLDQLEAKAFGKPSDTPDLSGRCDRLERYAVDALHKAPFGLNPEMADASPAPSPRPAANQQERSSRSIYTGPPPASAPMLERVAWMEDQVYGHEFSDEHLLDRLKRLDDSLFPNEKPVSDMSLMDQVGEMVGAVDLLEHERLASKNTSANSEPKAVPVSYVQNAAVPASNDVSSADGQPGDPNKTRHPLWHSIAHVLGEAGQMALGSVVSTQSNNATYYDPCLGGMYGMGGPGIWF